MPLKNYCQIKNEIIKRILKINKLLSFNKILIKNENIIIELKLRRKHI